MRPRGGNPYETVVEGERQTLEVTRRTLQRQQMTSVPGTFGDPIRVIQTLPGIQRAPFGLGLLLVRGSNPDDTGIYVDGHEVPSLFHFLGGPSIFNAEMLESIDLYPGGFPARFGRHHGGAVALFAPVEVRRRARRPGRLPDSGGYVRAPLTDLAVAVAGGGRTSTVPRLRAFSPGAAQRQPRIYYIRRAATTTCTDGRSACSRSACRTPSTSSTRDPTRDVDNLNTAVKFFRVIAPTRARRRHEAQAVAGVGPRTIDVPAQPRRPGRSRASAWSTRRCRTGCACTAGCPAG
jgi:hypothetical protein